MVKRIVLLIAVAAVGLGLGVAVAGRPQDVSSDVLSGQIVTTSTSSTTTTTAAPTSTSAGTAPDETDETDKTDKTDEPSTTDRPTTTATTTSSTTTSTSTSTSTTTSTTTPPSTTLSVARGELRVVIANATDAPGLATRTDRVLGAIGYSDSISTDAIVNRADTVVLYADGFEAAAEQLAGDFGLGVEQVEPRPYRPLSFDDEGGELWLLLGTDQL